MLRGPWLDKPGEMLLNALGFEPLDDDTLVNPSGPAAQTVSCVNLIRPEPDRAHAPAVRSSHPERAACARRAT